MKRSGKFIILSLMLAFFLVGGACASENRHKDDDSLLERHGDTLVTEGNVETLRIILSGSEDVATLNIIDNAKELEWDAWVSGYGGWTTPEKKYVERDSYRLEKGDITIDIFPIDKHKGLGAPLDEPLIEIYVPKVSSLKDLPEKTEGEISEVLLNIGIVESLSLENAITEVVMR